MRTHGVQSKFVIVNALDEMVEVGERDESAWGVLCMSGIAS